MDRSRFVDAIREVVELLVAKNYAAIATITGEQRLPADQIEAAITDYGRTLIHPPSVAFDDLDVMQVRGRFPAEFSVRFPLFTEEEGRSDLELQASLIDDHALSRIRVEIDGILVP